MITFLAEILDPSGTKLTNIETVLSLTAARSFNSVGSASLVIPDRYDRSIFTYNTRMRLWRRGHQGTASLFGDTLWFARRIVHDHSAAAYTIEFEDAFALLNSSIVAYSSKTPYADKTLEEFGLITPNDSLRIDNMMRAYVRENLSSLALDTTRDNPLIVVEEDRNLAPYGEKTAAWQRIGDVLSDLARMSAENGLELFYDFVPQTDGTFQFRVWDKVRGVDRGAGSFSVLTLSDQLNQLDDIQVVDDYTNLGTYVYVLGYDSGPSQIVVEQSNDEFIRSDAFGRVEFSVSTPDVDVESVLENTGQAALQGRRPRHTVSARVVDGSGILYGRDYAYGDRVMIHVGDRKYSCHVNAVRTTWAEGVEDLEVRLTGQEEDASSRVIEDGISNQAPVVFAGPDQEIDNPPDPPPPFVPPTPGDPIYYYGDMQAYVMWDGAHVFRTWDIQDVSPTWELIDCGISGDIYDGQYAFVDADTVGMWLMTSDGIYWCDNILEPNMEEDDVISSLVWGWWEDGGSFEVTGTGASASASVSAYSPPGSPTESGGNLVLVPPANTKRVVVNVVWSASTGWSGPNLGFASAGFTDSTHFEMTKTGDDNFDSPEPNTITTGQFTIDYFFDDFATEDWPTNLDDYISSPPASVSSFAFRYDLLARAAGTGGSKRSASVEITATVTEIELDDGTTYTPNCPWTKVLPIGTVQATEVMPETGLVGFKTMFNYASQPGFLCVATGPTAGSSNNPNYQHAYFWHTHDYGETWTTVDMNYFLRDVGGVFIHGYFHSGLYAMNIYRSAPGTIWCIRETPNIGGDVQIRVFYSSDLGHTWEMGATLSGNGGNVPFGSPALLNPFPDADDPSYATSGIATAYNTLQMSTDGWATKGDIATPTGYSGLSHLWRVNKRTFDNSHAIGWFLHTASNEMHLLQTVDGGTNWTLLHDSNLTEANIPNIPGTTIAAARHNTPNGWPPEIEQWMLVRGNGTLGDPVVQLTLDNFGSLLDKEGNLAAIIPGGWTDGPADGFALPKVAPNV